MSFQSRQKKRRYRQAVARSKKRHDDETARRWFLTLVTRKGTVCAVCGAKLVKGGEMVYRHEPRETRCVRCAGRLEDSDGFRPSIRWERDRRLPSVACPPNHNM